MYSIAVYQTPGSPLRTRRHASPLSMPSVPGPTSSARGSSVPPILPVNESSEGRSPLSDEDTNPDPVLHGEPALNFPLPAEEFAAQLDDSDGAHSDTDPASEPAIPPSPTASSSSPDSFALLDFFSESEKSVSDEDSDQVPGRGPLKCEFHPILNGTSELSIAMN